MGRIRRLAPLLVWSVALAIGIIVFHRLGAGPLAPPPLDPAGCSVWAAEREPLVAVIALLRLVVLGLAWYLVGVTTIGLLARLSRVAQLVRIADLLTVPGLRRILQVSLGLGLATAVVGATVVGPTVRVAAPAPGQAAAVVATSPDVDGVERDPDVHDLASGARDLASDGRDLASDGRELASAGLEPPSDALGPSGTAVAVHPDEDERLQDVGTRITGGDDAGVQRPPVDPTQNPAADPARVPGVDGPGRVDAAAAAGRVRTGAASSEVPVEEPGRSQPVHPSPVVDEMMRSDTHGEALRDGAGASSREGAGASSMDVDDWGGSGRHGATPIQGGAGGSGGEGAPSASEAPSAASGASSAAAGDSRTHLVVSGDSLWRIARDALIAHWGRTPSDAEVVPYWRQVIESNQVNLADPQDPDLIFPGQELIVPALPRDASSASPGPASAGPASLEVSP